MSIEPKVTPFYEAPGATFTAGSRVPVPAFGWVTLMNGGLAVITKDAGKHRKGTIMKCGSDGSFRRATTDEIAAAPDTNIGGLKFEFSTDCSTSVTGFNMFVPLTVGGHGWSHVDDGPMVFTLPESHSRGAIMLPPLSQDRPVRIELVVESNVTGISVFGPLAGDVRISCSHTMGMTRAPIEWGGLYQQFHASVVWAPGRYILDVYGPEEARKNVILEVSSPENGAIHLDTQSGNVSVAKDGKFEPAP